MSSHDNLTLFLLEQQAERQEQVDQMDYYLRQLEFKGLTQIAKHDKK